MATKRVIEVSQGCKIEVHEDFSSTSWVCLKQFTKTGGYIVIHAVRSDDTEEAENQAIEHLKEFIPD